MASKFRNAGQTCVSTNRFSIPEIQFLLLDDNFSDFLFTFRVLVHEAVHDAFVAKFKVRPSKRLWRHPRVTIIGIIYSAFNLLILILVSYISLTVIHKQI